MGTGEEERSRGEVKRGDIMGSEGVGQRKRSIRRWGMPSYPGIPSIFPIKKYIIIGVGWSGVCVGGGGGRVQKHSKGTVTPGLVTS